MFSADNGQTKRLTVFSTVFLIIKTSSQNISITLLKIPLKSHEHRGCYWRKKLPWKILEKRFPVPRNTAAHKIGNGIIPLLWQLRCHWNPYITSFHLYLIQLCSPPAIFFFFIATEFILKRRRYWPWITAPSHKCNNNLDCFLHEMLLITDSFFKKTKFARTFKKCFLSAVFESRKYIFFLSLLRDYWFLLFFNSNI